MNSDPAKRQDYECENAAFRADRTSGEPGGPMKRRIKQMSLCQKTAIRGRVEEGFAPVPRGVHSDGEPDIPSPAQGESREDPERSGHQRAEPRLSQILQMDRTEKYRKNDRRGPEADS